jgi:hypothetical protein
MSDERESESEQRKESESEREKGGEWEKERRHMTFLEKERKACRPSLLCRDGKFVSPSFRKISKITYNDRQESGFR